MALLASSVALTGCVPDKNIWIADSAGGLGYVNVDTGEVTLVGNTETVFTDIAFDPDGNLYGITFSALYTIDKATAQATLIGPHNNDSGAKNSLVFSSDGTLYAAWDALYTIDTTTGMSNLIGNGGTVYSSSGDLAFHKGNLYMTSVDNVDLTDELHLMDPLTGASEEIGTIGDRYRFFGLSSNKNTLYTIEGTTIYSVNPTTAELTQVASFAGSELTSVMGSAFEGEAKP